MTGDPVTRSEYCIVAVAECFRDSGEILANAITGVIPTIGVRLAQASFEPDLVLTDGEALLVSGLHPIGPTNETKVVEGWNPYRSMFDLVWSGRRHVMMGATQIDAFGNQNIAFIGDSDRPTAQLLGFRGAPGNTIQNTTSYWIPKHSSRVFVPKVDVVTGIGYDRAAKLGAAARYHRLHRVVTNLGVLDFETDDHTMRLRSTHPGVAVEEIITATGFEIVIPDAVPETRCPTDDELALIRARIDPHNLREQEVPDTPEAPGRSRCS